MEEVLNFFKITYVFLSRMGPELSGKDVQDFLSHPTTLGERREGEVVRVNLPQIWKSNKDRL